MAMMRMPEDMDRLLSAFASGTLPGTSPGNRETGHRSAGMLCLAIVLAAAAIAAHRLSVFTDGLGQRLSAGLLLGAGVLFLWAANRRG